MQKDKGSKIGWANKQKETLDIGVSKKSAGVIRLPRLNCYTQRHFVNTFFNKIIDIHLRNHYTVVHQITNRDIRRDLPFWF